MFANTAWTSRVMSVTKTSQSVRVLKVDDPQQRGHERDPAHCDHACVLLKKMFNVIIKVLRACVSSAADIVVKVLRKDTIDSSKLSRISKMTRNSCHERVCVTKSLTYSDSKIAIFREMRLQELLSLSTVTNQSRHSFIKRGKQTDTAVRSRSMISAQKSSHVKTCVRRHTTQSWRSFHVKCSGACVGRMSLAGHQMSKF